MEIKHWLNSKTIWFNVATGIVTDAAALQANSAGLSPQTVAVLGGVTTVGNIVLRAFFTNTALGAPEGPKQ